MLGVRGIAAILAIPLLATAAQPVAVDEVLGRVTAYVSEFIPRFAGVVATERYEQRVRLSATSTQPAGSRRLKADVLELSLSELAPAEYILTVEASWRGGSTRRQVPFAVTP